MHIPSIKKLYEAGHDLADLKAAEEAIMEGEAVSLEIPGDDEGDQYTHLLAVIWIMEEMKKTGEDFKKTLRQYTQRVRNSIS